jgi:hypothetical protein
MNGAAIGDRIALKQKPGFFCRIDRAWRAAREPEGVVWMSMGNDNGGRSHGLKPIEPIGSAIDHDAGLPPPHQQRAMAKVAAGSDLDLAAGPEKNELDGAIPKA